MVELSTRTERTNGKGLEKNSEPCCLCGHRERSLFFSAKSFDGDDQRYSIIQCNQCGLAQTDPMPSPEELAAAYHSEYYGDKQSKFTFLVEHWSLFAAKRRATSLLKQHTARNKANETEQLRILDIGCGRGVLLNAFQSLGHHAIGVERTDSPFSQEDNVLCGDLADLVNSQFKTERFDIIVIWHVLEHVDQPLETLQHAQTLLSEQGSLFISVPNFGSWQASRFKQHWFHLDLPRHLYHFDQATLLAMIDKSKFKPHRIDTFSLDQNGYGFLQSALNALPFLRNNHLYRLLKCGLTIRKGVILLLYIPAVTLIGLFSMIEILYSQRTGKGATLTIHAIRQTDD